ncbi:hypothetical protein HPP92_010925 [Vanilla planifolia]|uniref:Uncharacterized protein n=1 Tax=Vanilla planifolia TaxID=51239 RepID=A0A835QZT3_VANPL|nr:hypothetical protein HPP92_011209 [Vanilla planifolia]KAG0482841.1 hypothetical protein HPP92_010925 [Vanilla planifolia]
MARTWLDKANPWIGWKGIRVEGWFPKGKDGLLGSLSPESSTFTLGLSQRGTVALVADI